jgi:hypothetical protein
MVQWSLLVSTVLSVCSVDVCEWKYIISVYSLYPLNSVIECDTLKAVISFELMAKVSQKLFYCCDKALCLHDKPNGLLNSEKGFFTFSFQVACS